ncbi:PLP-dependent aminotransferase family protein (plasmid) [Bosea sp. F3-2]|uniref:aminotransferase-like domain-containing protein n=1 Tax=Bosea sp. F3-2 TaxID=2599640 RepID=UPI0011EBEB3F|nr:PLP-dependent aminotransferase family protein [Bosea sp. F3-2]QEL27425.1 PLP-dependent aminotransferase family protein [Bosea sp. F3-2]
MNEWLKRFANRADGMQASEIRELLKLLDRPDITSFAGGIPDPSLFPTEAFAAAYRDALTGTAAGAALQYSVSEGYLPLRQWLVAHMGRLGVACSTDNILITSGSQQALDYLGKLFIGPQDTVLITRPTYLGALQAFSPYEPRYEYVQPEVGNATPALYAGAAGASRSKLAFAYLTPDFANPTGETISPAGRTRMLDLCNELDMPLVEDAAYEALRYEGVSPPALLALDCRRSGGIDLARTIYCGTFSKTLSPGLRVGWVCAARPVIQKLVLMKQASDLHSPSINQIVMHAVADKYYAEHTRMLRDVYRRRRDVMLAALNEHMPPPVTWTRPDGGMFVWVRLPDGLDGTRLLERAIAEARVAFVPGKAFYADGTGTSTIRLSFSLAEETESKAGIERLARLVRNEYARLNAQAYPGSS